MTKIDLNRVWDDAKFIGRTNRELLTAIAGMFILLPIVLALQLLAAPEALGENPSPEAINGWYRAFVAANWPIIIGVTLVTSFGMLAILVLLLRQDRLTVAESLKAALVILPGYVLASVLQNFAMQLAAFAFIVPALYLMGRLALVSAACASEQIYNPVTMIVRSWTLTRGNGWRIFAMLAVIFVAAMIVGLVAIMLIGVVSALFLPADIADIVVSLAVGLVFTGLTLALLLVYAALYRSVTEPAPKPWLQGTGL